MADDNKTRQDPEKWQIRAEDGSIFGPATIDVLLSWARDGRLSPTHVISRDGETWTPVTAHPELQMDWVSEISPGRFYGPIHRDALEELVCGGTIGGELPRFVRSTVPGESPEELRAENESLRKQIEALRADFTERAAALEESLRLSDALADELRGKLETRDLDFEAERQAFRANESKLQAEAQALRAAESKWKADCASAGKKVETVESQLQQSLSRERVHAADKARIAELENELSASRTKLEAFQKEAEDSSASSRKNLRDAETALLAERENFRKFREEAQGAVGRIRDMRMREDSLRKLLQQATDLLQQASKESAPEIIEEGVLLQQEESGATPPPPPQPDLVLSAIEAQAQREIRKLDGATKKKLFK